MKLEPAPEHDMELSPSGICYRSYIYDLEPDHSQLEVLRQLEWVKKVSSKERRVFVEVIQKKAPKKYREDRAALARHFSKLMSA